MPNNQTTDNQTIARLCHAAASPPACRIKRAVWDLRRTNRALRHPDTARRGSYRVRQRGRYVGTPIRQDEADPRSIQGCYY